MQRKFREVLTFWFLIAATIALTANRNTSTSDDDKVNVVNKFSNKMLLFVRTRKKTV